MLHFGVTAQPTSAWTAQQLTEGFPFKNPQSCVLHDRYVDVLGGCGSSVHVIVPLS